MSFDIEIHGQKITLTNEDVEEIYRVQEREYRLCDARSAFQNRYEYDDTFEPRRTHFRRRSVRRVRRRHLHAG